VKILFAYADQAKEWNCSEWRCAIPMRAIRRTGRHSAEMISLGDFVENGPEASAQCSAADIIVVQRNLIGPVLAAIQHWKARDKTIIADFDDAYDLMPPSNPAYPFWAQGILQEPGGLTQRVDPPPLTQFKWGLRLVDAATVPSQRLADDWRPYADMRYLPNYIELEHYQPALLAPHDEIVVGWGGSLSHLASFTESGVLTALKRVCKQRPQVRVLLAGDRRVYEQLPLPPEQKLFQPWVSYPEWPRVLGRMDIGIAPLYGPYDERRSWIKVLEYMVMKIPWAASEGPAYHPMRSHGWLVKNTANAWERVLLELVDHLAEYRAEAAREAYLFGIGQSIDENIENIIGVLESVLSRRKQQDAA
jgi:glycosyltransferase involved in cell wall biosynthesis